MTRRRNPTTLLAGAVALSASLIGLIGLIVLIGGCSFGDSPPPAVNSNANSGEMTAGAGGGGGVLYASQEPIGSQLLRVVPPLKNQRFSALLDFENDPDRVFIAAKPPAQLVYERAHTGHRSLRIGPGTERVAVKLSSLLGGRPFPGDWTLLGAFLYAEQPIDVMLTVENAGFAVPQRKVTLAARTWTAALVDLSAGASAPGRQIDPEASATPNALLVLSLPTGGPAVWCDDVMLVDNRQTLVSAGATPSSPQSEQTPDAPTTAPAASFPSPWSLERRGLSYVGAAPGKFNFSLLTDDVSRSGWKIEEANELRARFSSAGGKTRELTVYCDGRSYWDAQYRALSVEARNSIFSEEHGAPAEVVVSEELGRVNRDTSGDANNDGYNERRAAYQLVANGPRLELKLTPHTRALLRPVLEITGLSPGKVLVTMEGRLIDRTVRLEDGTLLVEIPMIIERPTTINIRTQ
jgi:hypothetical protein